MNAAHREIARLLANGLSVQELLAGIVDLSSGPSDRGVFGATVQDFYESTVIPAATSPNREAPRNGGMFRTYEPYWRLFVYGYPYQHRGIRCRSGRVGSDAVTPEERLYEGCGAKLVADLGVADLHEAVNWSVTRAALDAYWKTVRREEAGRIARMADQKGARRNCVGALRYFCALAASEGLVGPGWNPAATIAKPGREEGNRRAFTESELNEFWSTVVGGGDDPELDGLLVETVLVTAARRGGLIGLSLRDLCLDRATLILHEKGERVDEQPATTDLVRRLKQFAEFRGARGPGDPVGSAARTGDSFG